MPETGKLHLRIIWDGTTVQDVEVKSSRPKAYRLLQGRLADDAVKMAPLLYSVCGKAQHAAALAAVSAAQNIDWPQNDALERSVICEAMQEHLWRLLLDWPILLGTPPAQQQFIRWHSTLNEIATGRSDAENLLFDLCHILLGMENEEWQEIDSYAKLRAWMNTGQGWLTQVLAAIDLKESKLDFIGQNEVCGLMPTWTPTELLGMFGSHLEPEFAALPLYDGKPMETGSLAQNQQTPLMRDILHNRPTRLLARVVARLVELLDGAVALASKNMSGSVQAIPASEAAGLSVARTARGILLHYVSIEKAQVANYLTVAPTEWNFHPKGALLSGLAGLKESDAGRLMETVKYFVLSLDPCVEYEIELNHA
jgi:coenzyme F420-reducing hydrogenase alpha subunit